MRLQRDRNELVAEVLSSSLPVSALLAGLLCFELLLALLAGLAQGWTALWGALVPLVPSLGLGWLVGLVHIQRVILRISPERVLLELTYPYGRKQTRQVALSRIHRVMVTRSWIGWDLALRGEDAPLKVPCASWADARRLCERVEAMRAEAAQLRKGSPQRRKRDERALQPQ